jgi:hypothetical protein
MRSGATGAPDSASRPPANDASTAPAGAHGDEISRGAPPSAVATTPSTIAPTMPVRTPSPANCGPSRV